MYSDSAEAAHFKQSDAASYDFLTEQYDRFESARTGLVQAVLSHAALRGPERVLDLGTGSGILALAAVERLNLSGSVLGIDLSAGMLERARCKRAESSAVSRIYFARMDAENLALADESFDAVISLYALLHFPDPLTALKEVHRVLRPGGTVVIAVGSGPPLFSLRALLHRFGRVPDLGAMAAGRLLLAPTFLEQLLERKFPSSAQAEQTQLAAHSKIRTSAIMSLLRKAGFTHLRSDWKGYKQTFQDAEEFWLVQRVFSSLARKRLSAMSEADQGAVKRDFLEHVAGVLSRGGRLAYPYAAFFAIGQRP